MSAPRWHCPPEPRQPGPWCDDLPCRGHRTRKDHLLAAEAIAWMDGYDDPQALPSDLFADYLTTAAEALHGLGHEVGR